MLFHLAKKYGFLLKESSRRSVHQGDCAQFAYHIKGRIIKSFPILYRIENICPNHESISLMECGRRVKSIRDNWILQLDKAVLSHLRIVFSGRMKQCEMSDVYKTQFVLIRVYVRGIAWSGNYLSINIYVVHMERKESVVQIRRGAVMTLSFWWCTYHVIYAFLCSLMLTQPVLVCKDLPLIVSKMIIGTNRTPNGTSIISDEMSTLIVDLRRNVFFFLWY